MGEERKLHKVWWKILEERDHSEERGVDGGIGSEWILGRLLGGGIGFDWLRIGTGGEL
jgi:hypothetical protein